MDPTQQPQANPGLLAAYLKQMMGGGAMPGAGGMQAMNPQAMQAMRGGLAGPAGAAMGGMAGGAAQGTPGMGGGAPMSPALQSLIAAHIRRMMQQNGGGGGALGQPQQAMPGTIGGGPPLGQGGGGFPNSPGP